MVVEAIGEEVVGPAEARRILRGGIADAVPLTGPVVFVHARLPASSFESGGRTYEYHDGMQGIAAIVGLARVLEDALDRLVAADEKVYAANARLAQLRDQRDETADLLRQQIVRLRRTLESPDLLTCTGYVSVRFARGVHGTEGGPKAFRGRSPGIGGGGPERFPAA